MNKLNEQEALHACLEPYGYTDFYFQYDVDSIHSASGNAEFYASTYDLQYLPTRRRGGTIIAKKGDFAIVFVNEEEKTYSEIVKFYDFIIEKLKAYNVYLEIDKNDLVYRKNTKKYKVAGGANGIIHGVHYSAIHISMSVDLDLIHKICGANPKTPMGLSSLVNSDIVEEIIKSYERN